MNHRYNRNNAKNSSDSNSNSNSNSSDESDFSDSCDSYGSGSTTSHGSSLAEDALEQGRLLASAAAAAATTVASTAASTSTSCPPPSSSNQTTAVRRRMGPSSATTATTITTNASANAGSGSGNAYTAAATNTSSDEHLENNHNGHCKHKDAQRHKHRHRKRNSHHHHCHHHRCSLLRYTMTFCRHHQSTFLKYWPTVFLALCFFLWMMVQTQNVYGSIQASTHSRSGPGKIGKRTPKRQPDLLLQRPPQQRSVTNFFSDAVEGFYDLVALPGKLLAQATTRGEALPPGCVRPNWQLYNLQNCNALHEVNLKDVFTTTTSTTTTTTTTSEDDTSTNKYVGSGYWRHVWLVKSGLTIQTVLKMMKMDHKVDVRNFERHRRDALAMERTTHSPFIVDIYAYCGNSVLTEYVGRDLYQVLYNSDNNNHEKNNNGRGKTKRKQRQQQQQPITMTSTEKLRLAWEVSKSVADLHGVPGGPIVQADITAKQFLVDDQGHIKLNDFNRCRFMGHHKDTGKKCTFRIPTAPGRHRSPEEYQDDELTEQLDVYSTANVLYAILTGKQPWDDLPSPQVQRAAKHGLIPEIDEEAFQQPNTPEAVLASIIEQAYEHDPGKRITASQMVAEIEDYWNRTKPTTTTTTTSSS